VLFDYAAGKLTARQTISTLPAGYAGSNFCSEILVSGDGKFVYVGNRRCTTGIGIFCGRRETATLTAPPGNEWDRGGNYPRSFAFDPSGAFLYCCNQARRQRDGCSRSNIARNRRSGRSPATTHASREPVVRRVPGTRSEENRPTPVVMFANQPRFRVMCFSPRRGWDSIAQGRRPRRAHPGRPSAGRAKTNTCGCIAFRFVRVGRPGCATKVATLGYVVPPLAG